MRGVSTRRRPPLGSRTAPALLLVPCPLGPAVIGPAARRQAARLEVERELAKARVELKRETEQLRLAAEQDRAQRERAEALRKRFKDLIDAVETVNGMHGELEVPRPAPGAPRHPPAGAASPAILARYGWPPCPPSAGAWGGRGASAGACIALTAEGLNNPLVRAEVRAVGPVR